MDMHWMMSGNRGDTARQQRRERRRKTGGELGACGPWLTELGARLVQGPKMSRALTIVPHRHLRGWSHGQTRVSVSRELERLTGRDDVRDDAWILVLHPSPWSHSSTATSPPSQQRGPVRLHPGPLCRRGGVIAHWTELTVVQRRSGPMRRLPCWLFPPRSPTRHAPIRWSTRLGLEAATCALSRLRWSRLVLSTVHRLAPAPSPLLCACPLG